MQTIKLKRGEESRRSQVVLQEGEPLITTDKKELWIGDGTTEGFPVGTVRSSGNIQEDDVALFGTTSRELKSQTKTDFLQGYLTETSYNQKLVVDVPKIKVNTAATADTASDALSLGGKSAASYVDTSIITGNYQDGTSGKLVNAQGIKALYDKVEKDISDGDALNIKKTSISDSTSSTSTSTVASSKAVKDAKEAAEELIGSVKLWPSAAVVPAKWLDHSSVKTIQSTDYPVLVELLNPGGTSVILPAIQGPTHLKYIIKAL